MSEQAVLWIFGFLITIILGLIAFLGRMFWTKLQSIDSGALATFLGRDTEREKQWMFWRESVDKRLDFHANENRDQEKRITKLERNGH